ncbi:MAG: NAD-binding protein [Candidatus Acidiferrales bacterium]
MWFITRTSPVAKRTSETPRDARQLTRNGTFNPGFRIRLHQKDLNLALSAAKELNLSLPNTAIAQQMLASCAAHGGAELDHSALILAIEGLGACSIREKK